MAFERVVSTPGGSALLGVSPFRIWHGIPFRGAVGQPLKSIKSCQLSAISFQLEPKCWLPRVKP